MIKLKQLLSEATFLDKMKKVNSGWDPKKALATWANDYEKDNPQDKADHKRYMKDSEKWIKDMSSKGPSVKVGDLVKVYMRSIGKEGIGKIVKETQMAGDFGFMGKLEPNKVPAWEIECYAERNIGTKKLEYKGKTYYLAGKLQYPQHEEGRKDTFSKL